MIFFLCMYKMVNITKKTYENNEIEVITDKFGKLWFNEKHVQDQLGIINLPATTNKYDEEYKKCRYELIDDPIKQSNRRFIRNDLALKIIMDCRTDKSCNFKRNLGFTLHDVINAKKTNSNKFNKRCIWRRKCATTIHCFRLQDWSLFS